MGAIGVIALNAFRESLRDKILYNLVLFAGLLIGLSVLLADLSITEHHKVIVDMGLAAINLIGVIIATVIVVLSALRDWRHAVLHGVTLVLPPLLTIVALRRYPHG